MNASVTGTADASAVAGATVVNAIVDADNSGGMICVTHDGAPYVAPSCEWPEGPLTRSARGLSIDVKRTGNSVTAIFQNPMQEGGIS